MIPIIIVCEKLLTSACLKLSYCADKTARSGQDTQGVEATEQRLEEKHEEKQHKVERAVVPEMKIQKVIIGRSIVSSKISFFTIVWITSTQVCAFYAYLNALYAGLNQQTYEAGVNNIQ